MRAVVFGSNGKIGRAVVRSFLKSDWKVVGVDLDANLEGQVTASAHEARFSFVQCDIAHPRELEKLFLSFDFDDERVDAFVDVSYLRLDSRPRERAEMRADFVAIHLGTALSLASLSCDFLSNQSGGGAVIMSSSIYAHRAPRFEVYEGTDVSLPIEYAASKAGLEAAVRFLAKKHLNEGIRCNAVAPGGVWNQQDQRFVDSYKAHTGKIGLLGPEAVASAVLFLASSNATAITGQTLIIDDGWTL